MSLNKPVNDIAIALRELLEAGDVRNHEAIAAALTAQGFAVSQPKISRLLHKIGAIKVSDEKGSAYYRLPHEYRLAHELSKRSIQSSIAELMLSVTASDTLVVVHTNPGAASLVARVIDQEKQRLAILGCIAGDDTIFIAPKCSSAIPELVAAVKSLFVL